MREIASPLQSAMLKPLQNNDRGLQVSSTLSERDLPALDEFFASTPGAWLRVYSRPMQTPQDWTFLTKLSRLRRLWIDVLPEHPFPHDLLSQLPLGLESLWLPSSLDAGLHLEGLARYQALQSVALSGRLRTLRPLSLLPGLKQIKLFRVTQVPLASLGDNAPVVALSIESSKKVAMQGLSGLPRLSSLDVFDSTVIGASELGEITALKRLALVCVKSDTELPSLAKLHALEALRVATYRPGYRLSSVLSARCLRFLSLDFMGRDCIDDAIPHAGVPPGLRGLYVGNVSDAERHDLESRWGVRIERDYQRLLARAPDLNFQ